MMMALALLLGTFLQGDTHVFISGSPPEMADSSSFWIWLIGGIILLSFLVTVVCFDGNGQKRPWMNKRQNFRMPDEDERE